MCVRLCRYRETQQQSRQSKEGKLHDTYDGDNGVDDVLGELSDEGKPTPGEWLQFKFRDLVRMLRERPKNVPQLQSHDRFRVRQLCRLLTQICQNVPQSQSTNYGCVIVVETHGG